MPLSPVDIYQHNLDCVSPAVLAGDVETALRHAQLPLTMKTRDAGTVLTSRACFEKGFLDFGASLRRLGATDYIRLCLAAAFAPGSDEGMIRGSHRSYVIGSGRYLIEPYIGNMTLVAEDDQWRCTEISYAIANHCCTVISPELLRRPQPGPDGTAHPSDPSAPPPGARPRS